MTSDADVVALINQQDERIAIWHIVIDPGWPMSRLSGAWVDVVAPAMYAERYLLPFADKLPASLEHVKVDSAGVLDPNATREAIAAVIEKLNAQHMDSPTKAGKPRATVSWPQLPEPLDWDVLPTPPPGVADDTLTSQSIAVAGWVSRLADIWAAIEVIRVSREYLCAGDKDPRPMPVVLRN